MLISRRTFITGFAGAIIYPLAASANQKIDEYMGFGENSLVSDPAGDWISEALDSKPAGAPPQIAQTYTPPEDKYLPGVVPLCILGSSEGYMFKFREGLHYDVNMFNSINWFLRCRGDRNASTMMDYRLIEHLNYVSHWFGKRNINIHSGYRTPAYNRKLKERNHKVAPNSFHMAGRAIDFSVDGISTRDVCSVALLYRNMQGFGGVGYYPGDRFVHIDTGPTRQWVS